MTTKVSLSCFKELTWSALQCQIDDGHYDDQNDEDYDDDDDTDFGDDEEDGVGERVDSIFKRSSHYDDIDDTEDDYDDDADEDDDEEMERGLIDSIEDDESNKGTREMRETEHFIVVFSLHLQVMMTSQPMKRMMEIMMVQER